MNINYLVLVSDSLVQWKDSAENPKNAKKK